MVSLLPTPIGMHISDRFEFAVKTSFPEQPAIMAQSAEPQPASQPRPAPSARIFLNHCFGHQCYVTTYHGKNIIYLYHKYIFST